MSGCNIYSLGAYHIYLIIFIIFVFAVMLSPLHEVVDYVAEDYILLDFLLLSPNCSR